MAKLSDHSIQILDGSITLTKRKDSAAWQARFKAAERWIRTTTKQKDLDKAKKVATDMYLRAKFREDEGLPIVSKRFDAVARQTVNKMEAALKANACKKVNADYVRVINRYLIKFFGRHNITNITYALITEYSEWLNKEFKHRASASALNTHNSALNKIFEEALLHNYMTKAQVPMLVNKGVKSNRRSDFTLDEYKKLIEFMRKWVRIKDGKRSKSIEMRQLLRDYVLILVNTGMRHGTESYGIKWKHLSWQKQNGQNVLMISVDGKTKQRELVARHNCRRYFERIHKRAEDLKQYTFDELIEKGVEKYVFRLSDGTRTKNLAQTFEILMRDSGLLVDKRTNTNRSLYSLRHTYATFALLYEKLDYFELEKQMGTSAEMIRKHYSHVTTRQLASRLAGRNFDKLRKDKEAKEMVEAAKAMEIINKAD